ncbi:hypothetical protein [Hansschlegelia sp. KR7-227]|uniref:hypothetical protein n=1 Tax=Hansschlegelia sp. KR7-227 TaxID=3400914 RepID=UPI003C048C0D
MPTYDDVGDAIHKAGHRNFVGGETVWDEISSLQFEFLRSQGLKPSHVLADIACGSLRAGIRLIPYLDAGNYIGIDKHIELIIYGVASELGLETFSAKRPQFLVSSDFDFSGFRKAPQFAIAQSLFTHLTGADIIACLAKFRPQAADGCRFFATFHHAPTRRQNPAHSHSWEQFYYVPDEMAEFGKAAGWSSHYIGQWNHPRRQHIVEYRPLA